MAQKTNSFERFWKELKRRKVVHVITVYAAAAFVILQLVDVVSEPLRLPVSTKALVIVLLCVGFIIAVFLSWVYDITPEGVKKTKSLSAVRHTDRMTLQTSGGWKIATYISTAIIIVFIAFNFIGRRNFKSDYSKLEKSIAVLPFKNNSPSDTNAYFINGLMEKVLNNLQMVKELRVISRTSVEQYRNPTKSIPEIAKELGVNFIVEGSGQKYGNTFSVSVQLIRAAKENHLWGDSFEQEIRETRDIVKVQSTIAQTIAAELKAKITPEEKQLIEKTPTSNLTAYDFYQRGNEELLKYSVDNYANDALKKAENFSRQALNYDSTFAQAYANLAIIYLYKYWLDINSYFSTNYIDSCLILANHALSYDKQLAEGYFARGCFYFLRGNTEQTLKEFDKALNYNQNYWVVYEFRGSNVYYNDPNYQNYIKVIDDLRTSIKLNRGKELPRLIYELGNVFSSAGFYEKALEYYKEALKLDEDSLSYFSELADLGTSYGNYENAIFYYKKCFAADSENVAFLKGLGENYMYLKQFKESLKYYNKTIEISKTSGQLILNYNHRIGYTYWQNGFKREASILFDKQKSICEESIKAKRPYATIFLASYYDLAGIQAFTGEKEQAYKNLRIMEKKPVFPVWWLTIIKHDPLFDNIRNESDFQQIQKDMEAKYLAEHERVRKWLEEQGQL